LGRADYLRACARLVVRLAEALEHAHQRGIFHRDIKPANILLAMDGEPLLLDFNLAQDFRSRQAHVTLGGTVPYMSPEHLRALRSRDPATVQLIDHRADIYSLGMVLYEMLTGRSPFAWGDSYMPLPALIEAMAEERSKRAASLRVGVDGTPRPHIPWTLESIVRKCLAPDPAQRYQKAGHLAEDLRRF